MQFVHFVRLQKKKADYRDVHFQDTNDLHHVKPPSTWDQYYPGSSVFIVEVVHHLYAVPW